LWKKKRPNALNLLNGEREKMNEDPQGLIIPCSECQAGQMHRRFLTYFTWLDDELITVPDFPAWVCDVCGRREYDMHALTQLNLLLNPNAGKSTRKVRRSNLKPEPKKGSRPSRPE
jgi:YgiT-type zinc finger domain-containing protein